MQVGNDVEDMPKLGKRELSLVFLICSVIVIIPIGASIRDYYDKGMWLQLIVTLGLTTSIFVIIKQCLKTMLRVEANNDSSKRA